jgi:hypothetical protein
VLRTLLAVWEDWLVFPVGFVHTLGLILDEKKPVSEAEDLDGVPLSEAILSDHYEEDELDGIPL